MELPTQIDGARSGILLSWTLLAREASLAKVHAPIATNAQETRDGEVRRARFLRASQDQSFANSRAGPTQFGISQIFAASRTTGKRHGCSSWNCRSQQVTSCAFPPWCRYEWTAQPTHPSKTTGNEAHRIVAWRSWQSDFGTNNRAAIRAASLVDKRRPRSVLAPNESQDIWTKQHFCSGVTLPIQTRRSRPAFARVWTSPDAASTATTQGHNYAPAWAGLARKAPPSSNDPNRAGAVPSSTSNGLFSTATKWILMIWSNLRKGIKCKLAHTQ